MIDLFLANVLAYSLQLTVLVTTALVVMKMLPVSDAVWRFRLWQTLFALAVILPLLQLSIGDGPPVLANAFFTITRSYDPASPGTRTFWLNAIAYVLGAGTFVRLAWLILGWRAISAYVARAIPLDSVAGSGITLQNSAPQTDVRLSSQVSSPATVGIWHTVILVPPRFLSLPVPAQRAVLAHELMHVERRDWLRMVVEETWCALLWFHPMARVLVSRLDLAREMLVDRLVIDATQGRRAYAEALLAFAGDTMPPARPLTALIRPRHLSQRIAALAMEAPMSGRLTLVALVTLFLTVSSTTISAVRLMPMSASTTFASETSSISFAAQGDDPAVQPGDGVTLPKPTHEQKPEYTPAAMEAKIEGTVLLAVVVQTDGTVGRVQVTKSLDTVYGLDEAAVRAARQWRFVPGRKDGKPVAVEVALEMTFTLRK